MLSMVNEQFVRFLGEFATALLCPCLGFAPLAVVSWLVTRTPAGPQR